jgi:RHS repeat-associated protein
MSKGGVLYYLHGDHLGSTSLTTDKDGVIVAQARYLPYGQERWTDGPAQTDFTFTGQRSDNYTHSIEMGARWYDPQLARWASADSIVPQSGNPQSLNRFSYVLNNPFYVTRYTSFGYQTCGLAERRTYQRQRWRMSKR